MKRKNKKSQRKFYHKKFHKSSTTLHGGSEHSLNAMDEKESKMYLVSSGPERNRKTLIGCILFILILLIIASSIGFVIFSKFLDQRVITLKSSKSTSSSHSNSVGSSITNLTISSSTAESPWLITKAENYLPILMYHNVQPNTPDGNFVSPENFESVLQALQSSEIYTVSSDEASKVLSTNTKPAQKLIWLTFDDGTQNFYDYVFPLLKKYNMHATSFIITNNVVNNVPGFMTAAEIKEIASTGLVDFQSHTVNHADLSVASDNRQTAELRDSKAYLDSLLNQKTHVICYPSGSHNPNTSVIASGLGYDLGLLDPGRTYDGLTAKNVAAKTSDGLFTLNRYRTFTNTTGKVVIDMISADEAYNVLNTLN